VFFYRFMGSGEKRRYFLELQFAGFTELFFTFSQFFIMLGFFSYA